MLAHQEIQKFPDLNPNHLISLSDINARVQEVTSSNLSFKEMFEYFKQNKLLPFVDQCFRNLNSNITLLLDFSDDLSTLRIRKIDNPSQYDFNGNLECLAAELERGSNVLAEIKNPLLVYSPFDIGNIEDLEVKNLIFGMYSQQRRVTHFQGAFTTWDNKIDQDVWSFNIDTGNLIHEIKNAGFFSLDSIKSVAEIGVGGGAVLKTLLKNCPNAVLGVGTDISSYAINCTARNIEPELKPGQRLELYLGKGIKQLNQQFDLVAINPPYIPSLYPPDQLDPYRGTGLIKEIVSIGDKLLNRENPEARIALAMSNLAMKDFLTYYYDNQLRGILNLEIELITCAKNVPLKISNIQENREWLDFLKANHMLKEIHACEQGLGMPFWHQISVVFLKLKQ